MLHITLSLTVHKMQNTTEGVHIIRSRQHAVHIQLVRCTASLDIAAEGWAFIRLRPRKNAGHDVNYV